MIDEERDFMYVFPRTEDVYEVSARFTEEIPDHTEEDVQRWLAYLRRNYPGASSSRLKDFGELVVNMVSAAGPLAEGECRKTRDLLRWYGQRLWHYWRYAMNQRWPVIWKTAGKVEMLPKGKLPRTFIFMDKLMALCFMRATSDFNDRIQMDRSHTRSALGLSIYGPEFIGIANSLAKSGIKFTCDVSRWDARMPQALFRAISLFRQESMRDLVGKEWIAYKYESMQSPIVCMPSGEVVRFDHGNMSGQDSTSTDNTIGHDCIVEEAVERTRARGFLCLNFIKLYGDDLIGNIDDESAEAFEEELKSAYIRHGFIVKESAFQRSGDLTGLTFLGGEFHKCKKYGCWTYVPSAKKLWESAHFSDKELTHEQLLGKIHSLYILAFHTPWKDRFHQMYLHCRSLVVDPPPYWDDHVIEAFVHGLEGPGYMGSVEDFVTGQVISF